MEYYGPRYKLEVLANNSEDHNPLEYLENIKRVVLENLRQLPHAPSAQMGHVPSRSVSKAIGLKSIGPDDPDDEIDIRVKRWHRRETGGYSSGEEERRNIRSGPSRSMMRRRDEYDDNDMESSGSTRPKRVFFHSTAKSPWAPPTAPIINGYINGTSSTETERKSVLNGKPALNGATLMNGNNSLMINGMLKRNLGDWSRGEISRAASPTSMA